MFQTVLPTAVISLSS